MPVFRLVYVSRVARPTRLSDVEAIVDVAVDRNASNGITGVLLYTPSHFIQALEGDEPVVRSTFERIRRDPRHMEPRILDARHVHERRFQQWAMTARPARSSSRELDELTLERALELLSGTDG